MEKTSIIIVVRENIPLEKLVVSIKAEKSRLKNVFDKSSEYSNFSNSTVFIKPRGRARIIHKIFPFS